MRIFIIKYGWIIPTIILILGLISFIYVLLTKQNTTIIMLDLVIFFIFLLSTSLYVDVYTDKFEQNLNEIIIRRSTRSKIIVDNVSRCIIPEEKYIIEPIPKELFEI